MSDFSKNSDDPLVMYLIVRESLRMSIGKTAAQTAHASQYLQSLYNRLDRELDGFFKSPKLEDGYARKDPPIDLLLKVTSYKDWLKVGVRKVVLKADDKEWNKLKEELPSDKMTLVVDAGETEIERGSETCIGIWPDRKSKMPKIIKKLQVL